MQEGDFVMFADKYSSTRLDRLQDAIVEDIINTSDEDILAEVAEEYGDPLKIARDMQVIIDQAIVDERKSS
jgi:predicted DsbA family dithiol-disulfide isomerase